VSAPSSSVLTGERGQRFRVLTWPAPNGAGLLLIHHGHGEHAGRWSGFAAAMSSLPLTVISYDVRGHGESDGAKGGGDLATLVDDFGEVATRLVGEHRPKRLFYLGHSMGGLVVARALEMGGDRLPRPHGLILSSPLFRVPMTRVVRLKTALAHLLVGLAPSLALSTGLDARNISRDRAEVDRYTADGLIHSRISLRLGLDLVTAGESCIAGAGSITLPVLCVHGTGDRVSDIGGTRAFRRALGSADASMVEFDGAYHELHHEAAATRQELFEVVRAWLAARLEGEGAA